MKTISDLIRHRTTLEVICTNCTNSGVLNHRYLANRFGGAKLLADLEFACHRCGARQNRIRFVSDHLGEAKSLKMEWFSGVYEKFQD